MNVTEDQAMEWRLVEESPDYEISEYGDLRNSASGKLGRGHAHRGYVGYMLNVGGPKKKFRFAHRLVAKAFLGPQPEGKPEVCHRDGTKNKNHYTNLYWGSHRENMADTIAHGTNTPGEKNRASKLKETEVREIRRLVASGIRKAEVARMFGIVSCTVGCIVYGRSWKHLT